MIKPPTILNYTYLVTCSWKKKFPGGGGWVVGLTGNRANSAPLELGLGLSLAKLNMKKYSKMIS